jgi:alpha-glucoside transport system permease protein
MAVASQTRTAVAKVNTGDARRRKLISSIVVNGLLAIICIVWTIPTLGLLVSSFRTREDIGTSGWWTILPHREWTQVSQITLPLNTPLDKPIQVAGTTVTDAQLRSNAGVALPNGQRAKWANRRTRLVTIQDQQLTTNANFSLFNYQNVLTGQQYTFQNSEGATVTERGDDLSGAFLNTFVVALPSTVIPILIAAFAAYAFAWMRFPGRQPMFALVVALLVVPLQVAMIPILQAYTKLDINGTFLALWLAHTGFGLSLAVYLLYNYVSQLPRDIFESAFIDGASPFTVFTRLVLPLSVPALASFAIFQFLWVWNDYLVALIFLGSEPGRQVLTMRLANIVGTRGQEWHLLTAGAFISMVVPLIVFFSLQRYFVRGLLAGSVKG